MTSGKSAKMMSAERTPQIWEEEEAVLDVEVLGLAHDVEIPNLAHDVEVPNLVQAGVQGRDAGVSVGEKYFNLSLGS